LVKTRAGKGELVDALKEMAKESSRPFSEMQAEREKDLNKTNKHA
jgi:hypothetical protein